jgi:DNA-binding NarL/FixJ family response regulator
MLELALPDGDGESILEAVQAKGLSPRTIILSGISDPGRLRAAQERFHPEAAFLKPAPPQALLGVCEQCRHRGSSFKPSRHGAVGK